MSEQKTEKKTYNVQGIIENFRAGQTPKSGTPTVSFTLRREGKHPLLVDGYGKAAIAAMDSGLMVDGTTVRLWGRYEDEQRPAKDGNGTRRVTVFKMITVERPKTAEEIAALKAAKAARTNGGAPAAAPVSASDAAAAAGFGA